MTRLVEEGDHKLGEQRRVRTEKYVKEERRKCNSVIGETELNSMLGNNCDLNLPTTLPARRI